MGVFAPLVGIIGSVQAAEALKLLMGVGQPLTGRLLLLDALSHAVATGQAGQGRGLQSLRSGRLVSCPTSSWDKCCPPKCLVQY